MGYTCHPCKLLLLALSGASIIIGCGLLWNVVEERAALSEEREREFAFNIAGFLFLWIACASAVLLHKFDRPTAQLGYVVAGGIFVYLIAFSDITALINADDARLRMDTTEGEEKTRNRKSFAGYMFAHLGSFVALLATTRSLSAGNRCCSKTFFMLLMMAMAVGGSVLLWEADSSSAPATRRDVWHIAEKTTATVVLALIAGLCDARYIAVAAAGSFGVAGLWVLGDLFRVRSVMNVLELDEQEFQMTSAGGALCWLANLVAMLVAAIVFHEEEVIVRTNTYKVGNVRVGSTQL